MVEQDDGGFREEHSYPGHDFYVVENLPDFSCKPLQQSIAPVLTNSLELRMGRLGHIPLIDCTSIIQTFDQKGAQYDHESPA